MRVLVACEYSGTVRDAFIKAGHFAISCDLLPSDSDFGPHYQGDVFDIINDGFDLMIGHPPCTYLTNSGVRWLSTDLMRWVDLAAGAEFFKKLLDTDIPRVAIENPTMHRYARELIGGVPPTQIVQPWMFGHLETKATCLWLKGLPKLTSTCDVGDITKLLPANERQRLHYLPPSEDRWKIRSKTYQGIADAMAEQWGKL